MYKKHRHYNYKHTLSAKYYFLLLQKIINKVALKNKMSFFQRLSLDVCSCKHPKFIDVILTTVGVCLYLGFLFGFAHAFLDGRRNYVNIEETKKTYCKRKAIKFACIINSILFLICLCMFSIITISIIAHS